MRLFLIVTAVCSSLFAHDSPFLPMHDTRLSETSKHIPHDAFRSTSLQETIAALYAAAKDEGTSMAGLAAPQIGIFERVILVDTNVNKRLGAGEKEVPNFEIFVNPQIIWRSRETIKRREGCYSTGPFYGIVERAERIKVCWYTPDGVLQVQDVEGYLARVFQHEVDHLDGIRFPDRLEKSERLHIVTEEMLPAYRKDWMDWNITCDLATWQRVKEGNPFTIPCIHGPEEIVQND